jgi:hypothetical protein
MQVNTFVKFSDRVVQLTKVTQQYISNFFSLSVGQDNYYTTANGYAFNG